HSIPGIRRREQEEGAEKSAPSQRGDSLCPCKGRQNGFRVFLRPFFEVGKKDIKKGFGKISGLEPLPTRFWAAFPGIFRESGSFLLSAKCRISTGVFVGLAEHSLQAQIPAR
ncbi:hypothetical protein, partial [Hominenteromicrobium sp.]|uniref:hypothetical protein n=1 Tax=Hominenteromicrobium sp. TaxID=3073581 RepID=UPI003AF01437